jgi:hypothetical protein
MCITSLYHVLSFCRSYLRGVRRCRFHSSTHVVTRLGCPPSLTQGTYFLLLPIYNALFIAQMWNPATCNLSFFQRHNGSGTKVWVGRVGQDYLCHRIGPNREYRILRAKRLTTRFGPTVVLTIRDSMEALFRSSCLGDTVTLWRTMILNRLIPMSCSCI